MRSDSILVLISLLMLTGCSSGAAPHPSAIEASPASPSSSANQLASSESAAATPNIDACALLTSEEIESVQGEPLKESKLSGQSASGLSISQCFFTLPTFTNSVSLFVAQKGAGAGAGNPREHWRETFHQAKARDKDGDRDRGKENGEEEEGAPPQKVSGVGEEAYWTASRVGGALYVLKGNAYLRVSIGGASDPNTQIKKSKTLAQKALARL